MSRSLEEFKPIKDGKVGLYTCGPTVYDFAHIGNFRTYVFEDLLRRFLEYEGFKVKHVMNLTDVEDKTIRKAREGQVPLNQITDPYIEAFFADLDTMNIERATVYPRATKHIPDMVKMIRSLLEQGIAYKSDDGSTYFNIAKFPDYGKLAHIKVNELQSGAASLKMNTKKTPLLTSPCGRRGMKAMLKCFGMNIPIWVKVVPAGI